MVFGMQQQSMQEMQQSMQGTVPGIHKDEPKSNDNMTLHINPHTC